VGAHHAFAAEYDVNKVVTVTGVVTKVEWMNPHARFYVDGTDDKGTKLTWNFELASINSLRRHGWTRESIKVGDKVKVKAYLARESADQGKANADQVTLADGRPLFAGSSANAQ
jgi:hypothetical protein